MLEDGTFFGEIPSYPGVWAEEKLRMSVFAY